MNALESLKTHLFIEFYYRQSNGILAEQTIKGIHRKLLFEAYGIFPGFDEIAKSIVNGLKKGQHSFRIKMNEYVTSRGEKKTYPIKSIEIIDDDSISDRMSYSPKMTIFSKDGVIEKLYINKAKNLMNDNSLIPLLMHEMTHAIEDYGLNQSGKRLDNELKKTGYSKYSNVNDNESNITKMVSDLLYYFNYFETNSYIAQLNGDLSQHEGHFETVNEILEYIKSLPVYKKYEELFWVAEHLTDNSLPESSKNVILDTLAVTSDYKFNTYNQFVKFLNTKLRKLKKKFYTIIPKIAYNHGYMLTFATKPVGKFDFDESKYNVRQVLTDLIEGKIPYEDNDATY